MSVATSCFLTLGGMILSHNLILGVTFQDHQAWVLQQSSRRTDRCHHCTFTDKETPSKLCLMIHTEHTRHTWAVSCPEMACQ